MRVKTRKTANQKTSVDATVPATEVDRALKEVREMLAAQLGLKADGLHTFEWLAKEQANIDDFELLVINQVIESFIPMAIEQAKLEPAFIPNAVQGDPMREGRSFAFSFEVMDKPVYSLSSYDPVTVSMELPHITEEQIEAKLWDMAGGYSDYVFEDAHPLAEKDSCLIELEAFEGGKGIDGLCTGPQGRVYTLGDNLMPSSFDKELVGMAPGDAKEFDFDAPDLDADGNPIAVTVHCRVKILENRAQRAPELTDEWLAKYLPLYKSVDEMRRIAVDNLRQAADRQYADKLRQAVAEELAKRFEGKIADEIYEATQANILADTRARMTQQGVDFEDYVCKQGNLFNMQIMLQTRATLIQGYALDAVFRHEGLSISEEDLVTWCAAVAPGQDPRVMRKNMERSGRGFVMREGAARLKANNWAAQHAVVMPAGKSA